MKLRTWLVQKKILACKTQDFVKMTEEEITQEKWWTAWSKAYDGLHEQAASRRAAQGATDWRPLLSYANNLDRMGDVLLDTDRAWVLIGRTVERPRQMVSPKSRGAAAPSEPLNERRMAERLVWQHPWSWSAGVLGGVWLVSVFVLSRRVKSLDRLK